MFEIRKRKKKIKMQVMVNKKPHCSRQKRSAVQWFFKVDYMVISGWEFWSWQSISFASIASCMNVCECAFFLSAAHKVTHHTDYLVENNHKTKASKLSTIVLVYQSAKSPVWIKISTHYTTILTNHQTAQ